MNDTGKKATVLGTSRSDTSAILGDKTKAS